MRLPDNICSVHGTELNYAIRRSGPYEGNYVFYCQACRRAKRGQRARTERRCRYGHLKTPWTWRLYGDGHRCLTCQYTRRAERKLRRAA